MRFFVIFFLNFFIVKNSYSYTWQWSEFCAWEGCSEIRAETIGDYCALQEAAWKADSRYKNYAADIVLIESKITSIYDGSDNLKASGVCVFNYYGIKNRYARLYGDRCPLGKTFDKTAMRCIERSRHKCKVGNPIEIDSGLKVQKEIDYSLKPLFGEVINISRTYKAKMNSESKSYDNSTYGGYWVYSFSDRLSYQKDLRYSENSIYHYVKIITSDFNEINFLSRDGYSWINISDSKDRLEYVQSDGHIYWKVHLEDLSIKIFDNAGRLIEWIRPSVGRFEFLYEKEFGNLNYDSVMKVRLNGGLVFIYRYQADRIVQILHSDLSFIAVYSYDSIGNLIEVAGANGLKKHYHYEDSSYHKLLTGITDERGVRYATWIYDAQGRAISSEHAGGAEKTLLAFNADGSTTVTNALNKKTIYRFDDIAGARRVVKVEGQPTTNCAGANQDYTYTPEGWVASKTDWKGVKTTYHYNSIGQEISRTEASGTPEARTTATEWHPTLFVKTKITEPEKETIYNYDVNGRLINQLTQSIAVQ